MRSRAEAAFIAAVVVLASAAAAVFLKLWRADLHAPFAYDTDATLNLMLIKIVMERGWFYENPNLGAPNEQQLYDYPVLSGDGVHVLFFWLAGLFTDNPALAMNVFFLLTFPVTAVTAYLVLRRLPVGRDTAVVFSLLYALLPYHFIRGEWHVFLSAYYAVPLGAYLALSVLDGRRVGLAAAGMAALVAVASGSFYYSAFTVFLVGVAVLLRYLVARERRAVVAGGLVAGVILVVSLAQLAPTIVYRLAHGTNDEAAERYWFESENYGLKITQLVLPVDGHRIDALARLKNEYVEGVPPTEGRAATLGIVATAGFLWLIAVAVVAIAGGVGRRHDFGLHARLAVLTVVALLVATTGGFATLIAVVWPQIRAWNRISVFIAFFALAAVALLVESLRGRVPRPAFAVGLAALLLVGAADQTTDFVVNYDEVEAAYESDRQWIRSLERRLPAGAAVVQLPYEPFPEPPLVRRPQYEPAKAYLHSSSLRWSYGAMRGRRDDWAGVHATKPVGELVPAAREAGFAAILVDRDGYPDGGAQVETELRAAVGAEPEASPDGRYSLFRL